MPSVYWNNGLRKITPYYNMRSVFVKGRWFGKTLTQVFTSEFKLTETQCHERIKNKTLKLVREGASVDGLDEKIENKDLLITSTHNHEPPVLQWCEEEINNENFACGIPIIYQNQDILVIDKPNGIPTHPTAYFYKNTLTEVLKDGLGYQLFPCHRLDKITSGILVFAKNNETAMVLQEKIRERSVQKWYLARVEGNFIESIRADSPIFKFEPKRNFPAAFSPSRESITEFKKLGYSLELNESLVLCKPVTGRTHQIRIHLSRLGHPIVNDPFYNPRNTKYPKRTKFMIETQNLYSIPDSKLRVMFDEFIKEIDDVWAQLNETGEVCEECGEDLPRDPTPNELELYLHAWKYEGLIDLVFQTKWPKWAKQISFA